MEKRRIYMDHAALSLMRDEVARAVEEVEKGYANPSSIHQDGLRVKEIIDKSRQNIASVLGCSASEVIFTSGGTEGDNLAILGYARANVDRGNHIITSQIEHKAVLEACRKLEKEGFEVTYLPVDGDGLVNLKDVERAIKEKTILISIMYANNEIGTIEPIREIARIAKRYSIAFHSDACQAAGYLDIDVSTLGVSMMTLNGTKIAGPTGIGVLFVKKGIKLEPLFYGGSQEGGDRPGTENVLGIVGFERALQIVNENKKNEAERLSKLRDRLIGGLMLKIPQSRLNGHREQRLPNNVNMTFPGVEGESLLLMLDEEGVAVSTGSACTSSDLSASHVLEAIGLSNEDSHGSLRFSLGHETDEADIDYVLDIMPGIVAKLRSFSAVEEV